MIEVHQILTIFLTIFYISVFFLIILTLFFAIIHPFPILSLYKHCYISRRNNLIWLFDGFYNHILALVYIIILNGGSGMETGSYMALQQTKLYRFTAPEISPSSYVQLKHINLCTSFSRRITCGQQAWNCSCGMAIVLFRRSRNWFHRLILVVTSYFKNMIKTIMYIFLSPPKLFNRRPAGNKLLISHYFWSRAEYICSSTVIHVIVKPVIIQQTGACLFVQHMQYFRSLITCLLTFIYLLIGGDYNFENNLCNYGSYSCE